MFLIKEKRKHGTNLCIVQSYRDPVTKVSKTKRIKNLGYLEDLQKEYADPIAHFQEVARKMSEEQKLDEAPTSITLDPAKPLEPGASLVKNYGYAALSSIYHELRLDVFSRGRQRDLDVDYSLNSVLKLLVYGRILYPGSIKQIYEKRGQFFDKMIFSLDDVYRSYSYLHRYKTQLQDWMGERISENYGQDEKQMYYYVTNHYFEVDEHDRVQKSKDEKEHRVDPIVQMGLYVDKNWLPISYKLFPRNPGDAITLGPSLKKARKELGLDKLTLVADNGTNSADGLYSILCSGNDYIVAQSIRTSKQEVKDYVLCNEGYVPFVEEGSKIKSRIQTRDVRVTTADGKKKTVTFKERQIIFHKDKYARCARAEREDVLRKSKDLIAFPGKYNKSNTYGAAKYVKNLEYDKKTGEILVSKNPLHLDEERLKEEERYDGYYMILTNNLEDTAEDIMNTYSRLWEVEIAFAIKDSTFRGRPTFVPRTDYIHGHFVTCYLALALTRILEMKIDYRYPLNKVLTSLRKCECVHIEDTHYIQTYFDEILASVGEKIGVDFTKRYGTLCKIRESLGSTKKIK